MILAAQGLNPLKKCEVGPAVSDEAEFKGKGFLKILKVAGTISGIETGRAKGLEFLTSEQWKKREGIGEAAF